MIETKLFPLSKPNQKKTGVVYKLRICDAVQSNADMIYEYVNGYMDMYSGIEYMIVMRHVYIYICEI